MEVAGHTAVLSSPVGALQAQANYGEVRRRLYAQEKEEMKEIERDFIDLMSLESLNAVNDAYQTRYTEMTQEFVDYGKQQMKEYNLRLPVEQKLEMQRRKRDILQQKAVMESSYQKYMEDRELLAKDKAMGTNRFDDEDSLKGMREFIEQNERSGGKEVYTNRLVPAYKNMGEVIKEMASLTLADKSNIVQDRVVVQGKPGGVNTFYTNKYSTNFEGKTLEDIKVDRTKKFMANAMKEGEFADFDRNITKAMDKLEKLGATEEELARARKDRGYRVLLAAQLLGNSELKYAEDGQLYLDGGWIEKYGYIQQIDMSEERIAAQGRTGGSPRVSQEAVSVVDNLIPWTGMTITEADDGMIVTVQNSKRVNMGIPASGTYDLEGGGEITQQKSWTLNAATPYRVVMRTIESQEREKVKSSMLTQYLGENKDFLNPETQGIVENALGNLLGPGKRFEFTEDGVYIVEDERYTSGVFEYDILNPKDERTAIVKQILPKEQFDALVRMRKEMDKVKELQGDETDGGIRLDEEAKRKLNEGMKGIFNQK